MAVLSIVPYTWSRNAKNVVKLLVWLLLLLALSISVLRFACSSGWLRTAKG